MSLLTQLVDSVEEKKTSGLETPEPELKAGMTTTIIVDDDTSSSDGDDALKLAGSHAHQFDEKYYSRLTRKIVSLSHLNEVPYT